LDNLLNLIKADASRLDQSAAQPRIGVVTSVDAATSTVRVQIQPEGVLTGWLPIASPWVGNGWGLVCPPGVGDQVLVIAQEGSSEHGIIIGRIWSSAAPPPEAQVGELWLMHKSGSYIKLLNNGSIVSSAANWTHQGDMHITGDVYDSHGALSSLRNDYNIHTHPPATDGSKPQN
jgi:phage gp45-like